MITQFLRDERGATAIEYSIIAGLIFLVIVGVMTAISGKVAGVFSTISTAMP